jgi:hypothetical protein
MTPTDGPTTPAPAAASPSERYGWAVGAGLVLLGVVLRLRGLSEYWVNPDEGIYYSTLTRASFGDFWAEVMVNAHPPAFYLLLRFFGLLTWDFVWLRGIASMTFALVAIWTFWRIGDELGGRGSPGVVAGVVAAGLFAINGETIALSQVMRPYMLLVALLSLALLCLLRYRSQPTDRNMAAYVGVTSAALLTHYSAVLAFGVFVTLTAYFAVGEQLPRERWRRLAMANLIPAGVFAVLYVQHMRAALGSDLMGDALLPGGWLNDWLVASPAEAWHSLVAFQAFHLPPGLQARAALLLLAAIAVSVTAHDRVAGVMCAAALSIALLASALGVYPFGPSRHNAWLLVFTLPTLGWLASRITARGPRVALVAAGTLVAIFAFAGSLERPLGARTTRTNATEEKVIRRADLAPLVVDQLDPHTGPRLILMSEQTYDVLMPLYAREREDVVMSSDSALLSFPYGSRRVVVARKWDWDGVADVRTVARSLATTLPEFVPRSDESVLLVAGGWGSSVFPSLTELGEEGAALRGSAVMGRDPSGGEILRLVAVQVEGQNLLEP